MGERATDNERGKPIKVDDITLVPVPRPDFTVDEPTWNQPTTLLGEADVERIARAVVALLDAREADK